MKKDKKVSTIILHTARSVPLLTVGVLVTVIGAVLISLLPPLVLADVIDRLSCGEMIRFSRAVLYFALLALTGLFETGRETLLTVMGQKIMHALRTALSQKLNRLPADTLNRQDAGAVVSRFVGDTDQVENLFTSGIVSLFADAFKIISILAVIFTENRGLTLLLCLVLPLIWLFTRHVQKNMLKAHVENREAVSRASAHVPETIRCIRTIQNLNRENYRMQGYDQAINASYAAIEKTNFYDAVYSPVILILNAVVVAAVMLLSSGGNAAVMTLFGMSVGTSVAVINYISEIFAPIESLGMEIQTIQSAMAGVRRIDEFLALDERWDTDPGPDARKDAPCVSLDHVVFGYDEGQTVLNDLSLQVNRGEHVTIAGRTGAGKSTVFRLLMGLYRPQSGSVKISGQEAALIPDRAKRKIFGYVEQKFHQIPGSVIDQITLRDAAVTPEMAHQAARLAGLEDTILHLEKGYDTPCRPEIFSQGQWQLLSIARAVAAEPEILLLDEITANLDADTEAKVLEAISHAAENRTVISISHRVYQYAGGRLITIE